MARPFLNERDWVGFPARIGRSRISTVPDKDCMEFI
jgi:hypothetical protein